MKKFVIPFFIATAIASIFFPWIIKYDVPYPGVMYKQYLFGFEIACGWINVAVAVVLAIIELWKISKNGKVVSFLRITCCMIGVLTTVIYSISMFLFENYDVMRPFVGVFVSMISYGFLLIAFSTEKANN